MDYAVLSGLAYIMKYNEYGYEISYVCGNETIFCKHFLLTDVVEVYLGV